VLVPNYIALAVPFFFALIGVEVWLARRAGRDVYRLNDAVSDISAGIAQQVGLIFFKGALLLAYAVAWKHLRLFTLSEKSVWTWVIAFVLIDFVYYWWHRLSHEVNVLWAAHVVHHSSEEYNLAVALRQGVATPVTYLPFHLPLALVGVPPVIAAAVDAFNTLYQFWIHTRLVGKMGPLEKWINTPALHRVHHAINPRYLDRNYGGTFMIWDRLFGTYEPETEAPVFGLVKPLNSLQPVSAQLHFWGEMWDRARQTPRLADKLRVLIKGPPWTPPGMKPFPPAPEVRPETFVKHDPDLPRTMHAYLIAQLAIVIAGATLLMFFETQLPMAKLAVGGALVYASLIAWGGFLEGRRWALALELARLGLLIAGALALAWGTPYLGAAAAGSAGVAVIMAAWITRCSRKPQAVLSAP
jgi:sterol desaturase/sphingolipid hydroxylase (fatty acid hydroxylase superfamily)